MIELEDVHARRNGVGILHGVSLRIAAGEAVVLFGRNGMGKTTTLDCIAGRVVPASGSLRVLGGSSGGGKPHRTVPRSLGYVPESRGIFLPLTVGEHLRLSRRPGGWPADRILALFPDLQDRLGEKAGRLSGGQQQMVSIARALSADPAVLMLDEPTTGLAPLVIEAIARVAGGPCRRPHPAAGRADDGDRRAGRRPFTVHGGGAHRGGGRRRRAGRRPGAVRPPPGSAPSLTAVRDASPTE